MTPSSSRRSAVQQRGGPEAADVLQDTDVPQGPETLSPGEEQIDSTPEWRGKFVLLGLRVAVLVAVLVLWEYLSTSRDMGFWIGRPSGIYSRLIEWGADGFLLMHVSITVRSMVYGLLLGTLVGISTGFLLGLVRILGQIFDPFIMAIYAMPKIALAPLYVLWFGIGMQMRTILVGTIVFFLVFINTYAGVRERDRELIEVMQVMGAHRRQIITKLVLPGSLSYIVVGLKLAIPNALTGAVFGEIIASNRGIGYLLMRSAGQFDTTGLFAALVVLMVMAIVLNAALNRGSDKFLRWKSAGQ